MKEVKHILKIFNKIAFYLIIGLLMVSILLLLIGLVGELIQMYSLYTALISGLGVMLSIPLVIIVGNWAEEYVQWLYDDNKEDER